jgi:hypothetical protein
MATVESHYTANPQRYCGAELPSRKVRKKFERAMIDVHGVLTRTEMAIRFPRASCLCSGRRLVIESSGLKKLGWSWISTIQRIDGVAALIRCPECDAKTK